MSCANSISRSPVIAAAALAAVFAIALPALATAATVEVRESGGERRAALDFRGDAGGNQVEVSIANPTAISDFYEVQLVDSVDGIKAGANCSGPEAPKAKVICQLHRPTGGWTTNLEALLGAGDNTYDARQFNTAGPDLVRTQVVGGPGEDLILTGNSFDLLEPGADRDEVRSGDGNDGVLAASSADGNDLYDLGGGFDQVSYSRRAESISSDGISAGSAGERDQLNSVEALIGGGGNDTLTGTETTRTLDGAAGDDTLNGSDEANSLYGGLGNDNLIGNGGVDAIVGGSGDDTLSGGDGDDNIKELLQEDEAGHLWVAVTSKTPSAGNDTADAGGGSDLVELGPGIDKGLGGPGVDLMRGGPDNDELDGGDGEDGVAGEGGSDRLLGGNGFDEILAGRIQEPRFDSVLPVDPAHDTVDCGPNQDVVLLNRWDSQKACENVRLIRIVEPRTVKRNVKRGTARLNVAVVGPGALASAGAGLKRFGRQVKTAKTDARTALVLPIVPRGNAERVLERRGRVTLRFWLRYRQPGALARSEPFTVTVVGPPPPKPKKPKTPTR
jgi:Ca2+-binding RTX toxin-like protein